MQNKHWTAVARYFINCWLCLALIIDLANELTVSNEEYTCSKKTFEDVVCLSRRKTTIDVSLVLE